MKGNTEGTEMEGAEGGEGEEEDDDGEEKDSLFDEGLKFCLKCLRRVSVFYSKVWLNFLNNYFLNNQVYIFILFKLRKRVLENGK